MKKLYDFFGYADCDTCGKPKVVPGQNMRVRAPLGDIVAARKAAENFLSRKAVKAGHEGHQLTLHCDFRVV